jgi:hypothetical protein
MDDKGSSDNDYRTQLWLSDQFVEPMYPQEDNKIVCAPMQMWGRLADSTRRGYTTLKTVDSKLSGSLSGIVRLKCLV